jgi:DNA-directed RNA polymerase specialized sigma24 family protein
MAQLTKLNSRILMSYYEGFTCAELAVRYDLTTDSVKVRVHRSRRRIKQLLATQVARMKHAGGETGQIRS